MNAELQVSKNFCELQKFRLSTVQVTFHFHIKLLAISSILTSAEELKHINNDEKYC